MAWQPRIAVLVSGRGSNLQSLIDERARGTLGAQIVGVISNRPGALALDRARAADLPTVVINHRHFDDRQLFEAALVGQLREWRTDYVILAGFMRVLTGAFIEAFPNRVINIHPSLLPAFPGIHAQKQAWEYGVKVTGCTAHFVDSGTDTGPIIMQSEVPVLDDDTPERLATRILDAEHRLLPLALRRVLTEPWCIHGRRVVFSPDDTK